MRDLAYLNAGGYSFNQVAYNAAEVEYNTAKAAQVAAQADVDGYDADTDTAEDLAGWQDTLATVNTTLATKLTAFESTYAASDVDADHDNKIDMDDLAIIDGDWMQTIHGDIVDYDDNADLAKFTGWDLANSLGGDDMKLNGAKESEFELRMQSGDANSLDAIDQNLGTNLIGKAFTNTELDSTNGMNGLDSISSILNPGDLST